MKNHYKTLLSMAMVLASVAIIATKHQTSIECPTLCKEEDRIVLNQNRFLAELDTALPQDRQVNPMHLYILVEPSKDCPSCLEETPYWTAQAEPFGELFDYTLVMNAENKAFNDLYLEHYNIPEDNQLYLDKTHPLLSFRSFGVLKVLVEDGQRIAWYEMGNKSKDEYEAFSARLQKDLANFGS